MNNRISVMPFSKVLLCVSNELLIAYVHSLPQVRFFLGMGSCWELCCGDGDGVRHGKLQGLESWKGDAGSPSSLGQD